ncbi:hypothetical protein NEIELOOT_01795, partial [Neisseria elongata subsp. glycolytica ATCC 29315]
KLFHEILGENFSKPGEVFEDPDQRNTKEIQKIQTKEIPQIESTKKIFSKMHYSQIDQKSQRQDTKIGKRETSSYLQRVSH